MKKNVCIAACILTGLGLVLSVIGLWGIGFDFTRLSTANTVTSTYEITEDFQSISIDTHISNVRFALSEDGSCKVVCKEPEKMPHSAQVSGDTLTIRQEDNRKWYNHIGIFIMQTEVTVYLPRAEYVQLQVHSATGDIEAGADFSFDSIILDTNTGDISVSANASHDLSVTTDTGTVTVTGAECQTVSVEVATGDVELKNVIAAEKLTVESATGDVVFTACDAGTIAIDTDTGDVTGTLLSGKTFYTDTSTGDIRVPSSTAGGSCRITTDTGDISVEIQ